MPGSSITDLETLLASVRRGHRPSYLLFWGHQASSATGVGKECLSQWWSAPFVVDGHRYPTAEHFMMAEKAHLFGDEEIRRRDDPNAENPELWRGRNLLGFALMEARRSLTGADGE